MGSDHTLNLVSSNRLSTHLLGVNVSSERGDRSWKTKKRQRVVGWCERMNLLASGKLICPQVAVASFINYLNKWKRKEKKCVVEKGNSIITTGA